MKHWPKWSMLPERDGRHSTFATRSMMREKPMQPWRRMEFGRSFSMPGSHWRTVSKSSGERSRSSARKARRTNGPERCWWRRRWSNNRWTWISTCLQAMWRRSTSWYSGPGGSGGTDGADARAEPELLVVAPPATDDPPEDWFETFLPRAAYVYRDHARLWLTVRTLERAEAVESPDGLRVLIEAVYGPEAENGVPPGLLDKLLTFEGRESAARSMGHLNTLSVSSGYVRDAGAWDSDVRTPTRLTEDPRVTLRLALVRGGRIEPYALEHAPDELWRAWRLSEVDVSQRHVASEAFPLRLAEVAREVKADWGRYDEDKVLVVLEEAGDGQLVGAVMGPDGERAISYTDETGLAVKSRQGSAASRS